MHRAVLIWRMGPIHLVALPCHARHRDFAIEQPCSDTNAIVYLEDGHFAAAFTAGLLARVMWLLANLGRAISGDCDREFVPTAQLYGHAGGNRNIPDLQHSKASAIKDH